ncbi:MAG: NmrA family NAD(P)-binding protein [Erysipelotrichales bacterium]|nr:NmrA family NAD(P)-binding protein [Erysipelotrichales bacterium]MBQ5542603.1 NmrA family NAD(P)-binding protein [Erysipelotrichales bacterium]
MKVLLAGAFGNLGFEILKTLAETGHEIIAADLREKENNGLEGKYTFKAIDATNPKTLEGLCDGVDIVITTMGLTTASTKFTAYDIDYQGNMNLYHEAVRAGVKKFNYISVIACDQPGAEEVPMLHAKFKVEEELRKGSLEYVIYRPTGYFYDIAKVFKPYVDKGEMQLLKGYHGVKANVVDCPDFAKFIVEHMEDTNKLYEVGGKETYTYEEMAKMCFRAAGKPCVIKDSPIWMFGLLANLPKIKKAGKHDIILFSKWTLSHDLVGKDVTGDHSFAEYIKEYFGGKK